MPLRCFARPGPNGFGFFTFASPLYYIAAVYYCETYIPAHYYRIGLEIPVIFFKNERLDYFMDTFNNTLTVENLVYCIEQAELQRLARINLIWRMIEACAVPDGQGYGY